jgi:hypothetical protein
VSRAPGGGHADPTRVRCSRVLAPARRPLWHQAPVVLAPRQRPVEFGCRPRARAECRRALESRVVSHCAPYGPMQAYGGFLGCAIARTAPPTRRDPASRRSPLRRPRVTRGRSPAQVELPLRGYRLETPGSAPGCGTLELRIDRRRVGGVVERLCDHQLGEAPRPREPWKPLVTGVAGQVEVARGREFRRILASVSVFRG